MSYPDAGEAGEPSSTCRCAAPTSSLGAVVVAGKMPDRVGRRELQAAIERWHLTAREAEVVALVADGEPNKEIASRLRVASRTIEVHVTSALRKANVESRARLIARFWTRT